MSSWSRSLVFRHTLLFVGFFVIAELIVFGVLYASTITLYERRENAEIHADVADLRRAFDGMSVAEMAALITRLCNDQPGETDEYLLTTSAYDYIAGNIARWPEGTSEGDALVDLVVDYDGDGSNELHRIKAALLGDGNRLLVGRNLSEFQQLESLIGRALLRTVLLTVGLGLGGGYLFSRRMWGRLDQISHNSLAILDGDIERRMPVSGRGDEFDRLAANLNRMLDRITGLMRGMRDVTENIAHDMRKPISRLRSRIEVTLLGPRDAEAYREALARTVEETEQILAMFNALLTIALAEARVTRENFVELDLMQIARDAVEVYEPAAEEAGFVLKLRGPSSASCRGNPHLLSQAVANLLDNAIKHVPDGGELIVAVAVTGDTLRLSVADRGPGIPDSFRRQALDRFSRLEESRTTFGSGLGLSLVSAVASLHGGRVDLEDNRPGLRVVLSVPAEPPEGTTLPRA